MSKYLDNIIYVNGKQMDIEVGSSESEATFEKIIDEAGKKFWRVKLNFLIPDINTINIFETCENYPDDNSIDKEQNVLILPTKRDVSTGNVEFKLPLKKGSCFFTHNKKLDGGFSLSFGLDDTEKKDNPFDPRKKDNANFDPKKP